MRIFAFAVATSMTLFLAGCTDETQKEAKVEPTQTVEWFKEHKEEREAMRKQCANNPGELEDTPNCINAEAADAAIMSDRMRSHKGIKREPLKF
jgi:PBP1b-binding outer membrane lipoprotein LpoB